MGRREQRQRLIKQHQQPQQPLLLRGRYLPYTWYFPRWESEPGRRLGCSVVTLPSIACCGVSARHFANTGYIQWEPNEG